MAKKVVATLKKADAKGLTRVVKMIKSEKTGAYIFKEEIVSQDLAQEALNKIK
jgi:hypothetical protein